MQERWGYNIQKKISPKFEKKPDHKQDKNYKLYMELYLQESWGYSLQK